MVKIFVFDFDGTLVYSNEIKYDAYFKLFPQNEANKLIIKSILDDFYEESREFIIRKIIKDIEVF